MTAAEAASAGASGGGGSSSAGSQSGGGVSKVLIASLAGAAGAGAYVGLNVLKEEYAIRIIGLRASRSSVLLGTGSISFSFEAIEEDNVGDSGQTALTYFWDYGDGTTATHTTFGPQPQPGGVHEY